MIPLKRIAEAWYNFRVQPHDIKVMMQKRLDICDSCPFKREMNQLGQIVVTNVNQHSSKFFCKKCGCPLSVLTAHPSSECKDQRWGKVDTKSYF